MKPIQQAWQIVNPMQNRLHSKKHFLNLSIGLFGVSLPLGLFLNRSTFSFKCSFSSLKIQDIPVYPLCWWILGSSH